MPRLTIDIEARLAQFQDSLNKIERDAGGVAKKIEGAFAGLNTTLGALGATLSVGAFAAFVKDGIAAQAALDDLSESTSLTVETLSSLRDVARISGADLNQVAAVAGKFAKSVGEAAGGNKELQKAFADVGISVDDLRSKKFDDIYVEFAKAIAGADDQQRAFAVGAKLAGRNLQEVLPFLKDLASEGLKAGKVSAEQAAAAEKLEKDIRRLGSAFDDLKITLAQAVVPALQELLDDFNEGIRLAGSFSDALRLFGLGINPLKDTAGNLKAVREELEKLQAARRLREAGAEWTGDLDAKISDAEKKLAFLKSQQSRAALLAAGDTRGNADARDLRLQGRGVQIGTSSLATDEPAKKQREIEGLTKAQRQLVDAIDEQQRLDREGGLAENGGKSALQVQEEQAKEALRAQRQLIDALDEQERLDREAGLAANAGKSGLQELEEQTKRNRDVARELGLTFSSAFEDAIIAGRGLQEVIRGIGQDLVRIVARKTVTEPLAGAATSFLGPLLKGLVPSFDVGTPYVPRDMLAFVHKGEAIIPAGRAAGGVSVSQSITLNVSGGVDNAQALVATIGPALRAMTRDTLMAEMRPGGLLTGA